MARRRMIVVDLDTKLKDIKVGDLVATGEVMLVKKIKGADLDVVDVLPKCGVCCDECRHTHVVGVGYGQQNVLKIVRGGASCRR